MHLEKIKQNKILYLIIKSLSVCFVLLNIFILKNFYIGLISILLFVLLSGKDFEIIYKYKFKNIEYPYIFGIFTSIFIPLLSSIFLF